MAFSFDRSRPGTWISGGVHLALLAVGIFAFTTEKLPDAEEGIPVEVITDNQLSQITKGEKTAAEVKPDQKPRVDKVADTPTQRDPGDNKTDAPSPPKRPADLKLAEEEVEPTPSPPKRAEVDKTDPPPMPPSRPPEPSRAEQEKKEKAQKAASEQKAAEEKKLAEEKRIEELQERKDAEEQARIAKAKADQAREAKLKAEQAKAEEQKRVAAAKLESDRKAKEALEKRLQDIEAKEQAEAKAKAAEEKRKLAEAKRKEQEAKARRQAELADKFSPGDINKMLTSHEPTRAAGSTGREVQRTASLGTATGSAQRLNPSQRDQIMGLIREQLIRCWQPPIALQTAAKAPTAVVRLALAQDGSLSAEPKLMNSSSDPLFHPVADSALRATRRCAPLRIPAQFQPFYADWRDIIVNFDPREMG